MRSRKSRRYQRGSLCTSPDGKRWIAKWYAAPGRSTSRILGLKSEISRKAALLKLEEIVRPLNRREDQKRQETVGPFVEGVFFGVKRETGAWRENTAKESESEIRRHLLPDLADVSFDELTPSHPRAVLRKKAAEGLGRNALGHLTGYLKEIGKMAVAEGYLDHNVCEGLKPPKPRRPANPKETVSLAEYAAWWEKLEERERLAADLVMFGGLRESEAYGLWCGDLSEDEGIWIQRSWFKGRYEDPKTTKSRRTVYPPLEIMERLRGWISGLPGRGPQDPVFPSQTLVTPLWPENVLRNCIRPKVRQFGLPRINFQILRRTRATLHRARKSDPKAVSDQQGHGIRTHLEHYVQTGPEQRRSEDSKFYADFVAVQRKQG